MFTFGRLIMTYTSWDVHDFIYLFIYLLKFIYFQTEREHEHGRDRERIPIRLHAVSTESDVGLELTNCETMT